MANWEWLAALDSLIVTVAPELAALTSTEVMRPPVAEVSAGAPVKLTPFTVKVKTVPAALKVPAEGESEPVRLALVNSTIAFAPEICTWTVEDWTGGALEAAVVVVVVVLGTVARGGVPTTLVVVVVR